MEQELNVIQKLDNNLIISKSQLTKLMTVILTQVDTSASRKLTFLLKDTVYFDITDSGVSIGHSDLDAL
ncbi:hypothetical protein EB796_019370 [Bugula neritina]|uniref:Uncharacterized protein n=1 Tax=Bugula neritina TaxID=10212 RepID=A0A7J7J8E6_BUGNE|nr:hypothetical protein EB796_019370 [Bugula neritina]